MGLQFSAFPRINFFQPHVVCATPARCQGFASREEAPLSYVLSHLECYYLKTGLTSVGRKGIACACTYNLTTECRMRHFGE